MKEIWKPIAGYEGLYEVSNLGRVRSKDWIQLHSSGNGKTFIKKGKFISPRVGVSWNGYTGIMLSKDKKQRSLFLHRIIAIAFIPNPEGKPFINHKNGIKTDNRIENLEWCTRSENVLHAISTGLQKVTKGQDHPTAKFTEKDVLKIRERYSKGESSWKIYKDIGGSYTNIKSIIAKRSWTHI